jgi:iron complex transport system substrate-binding protein
MRVVSLLPSATEILFAIGAGDQVVGVTHECDFPEEAKARPVLTSTLLPAELDAAGIDRHVRARVHVGSSLYGLDDAKLAALEPDLIVTQELCAVCAVSYEIVDRAAKRLRGDPRLVSLEPSSLEDVFATIAFLGDLVGAQAGAATLLASLRARVEALRACTGAVARNASGLDPLSCHPELVEGRKRLLVLEWTDPPMSAGHWTPGLIELAGGEPVLGNPGANSRVMTWDEITAADPDVIVVAPCGFGLARTQREIAALPSDASRALGALRAVREGRAYAMDGNAFVNRPGPRLVDTAELFAAAIAGNLPAASDALARIAPEPLHLGSRPS